MSANTTKTTTRKAPVKKPAPVKKVAPKAEAPKGRQPVTPDQDIIRWIKAELRQAERAGAPVPSAAGLLRAWREQGGQANPQRFSRLVVEARD